MVQYREISICIDCEKGSLVNPDGTRMNRDDLLPRLILADEVILLVSFVRVIDQDGIISTAASALPDSMSLRIIGDCDRNNDTNVMFAAACVPEKSDFAAGVAAFLIQTNSVRFADVLNNAKSRKCEFVILARSADPVACVVLAKDSFIAENRPCETGDFVEPLPEEIITREELQALLDLKSPVAHTHVLADISDYSTQNESISYQPGNYIEITDAGVINCTLTPCECENNESVAYTPGDGININNDEISIDTLVVPTFLTLDNLKEELRTEFNTQIGDINAILDDINGEEV